MPMQQYIPENTNESTKLDVEAITAALIDSHIARFPPDDSPTLSKYNFVSELLTLIHVSIIFLSPLRS